VTQKERERGRKEEGETRSPALRGKFHDAVPRQQKWVSGG